MEEAATRTEDIKVILEEDTIGMINKTRWKVLSSSILTPLKSKY